MPPFILKIAQLFSRRPADRTIRLIHIFSGIVIAGILMLSWDRAWVDIPFFGVQNPDTERVIEYGLLVLGILPFFRGLISACFFRHKTLRILQGIFGLLLIIVGGPILDPIITELAPKESTDTLQLNLGPQTTETRHPGTLLVLIGVFWLLVGVTGKGTTQACIRYGEVIKKIRV